MTRLALYACITAALVALSSAQPRVAARETAYRANNIGVAYLEQYNFPSATASFREALQADPKLGERERKLLATIYRELVVQREAGRGG